MMRLRPPTRCRWTCSPVEPSAAPTITGSSMLRAAIALPARGGSAANPAHIYSYSASAAAPSTKQLEASISPWSLMAETGIAADSKYLYIAGTGPAGQGIGPQKDGIYRFDRANLSGPPTQIASFPVTGSLNSHVAVVLDDIDAPQFLYGRSTTGDIHVVINPAGSAEYVGTITTLGTQRDRGMTYDPVDHALYFIESESDPTGRIVKLE
jgi:hypothetical protein